MQEAVRWRDSPCKIKGTLIRYKLHSKLHVTRYKLQATCKSYKPPAAAMERSRCLTCTVHGTCYKLHVTRVRSAASYKLEVRSYKLQATSYKLQATSCKLQAASYKLHVTKVTPH